MEKARLVGERAQGVQHLREYRGLETLQLLLDDVLKLHCNDDLIDVLLDLMPGRIDTVQDLRDLLVLGEHRLAQRLHFRDRPLRGGPRLPCHIVERGVGPGHLLLDAF